MHLQRYLLLVCCLALSCSASPVPDKEERSEEDVVENSFAGILSANEENQDQLYEGDILLPKTRNPVQDKTRRWPLGTPVAYEIDVAFSYEVRSLIVAALQEIQVRSCLMFVEKTDEVDYLRYFIGSGCFSSVGMVGGYQPVSIGGGCAYHRTIIHETFHALGFWHEQSRTDRDDNVQIVWEAISEGSEGNFDKYGEETVDLMGTPYDYASIMHYHDEAFSKDGSKTIIALKEGGQNMGRIDAISSVDLEELNRLYEGQAELDSFGYTKWTAWSACDVNCEKTRQRFCDGNCTEWGKTETEKSTCENCEVGLDPDCGPRTLAATSGTIQSPLYPYNYKNSVTCTHTIEAPDGARVHLSFQMFDLEANFDYVRVYDGADASAPQVGSYSGDKLPKDIISSANRLTIVFDADYAITAGGYSANYYINAAPLHLCQFENINDYCGWTDDTTSQLKFIWNSGLTPSSSTGPNWDHSYGNSEGHYLFLEASSVTQEFAAGLLSPTFQPSNFDLCFSMWYSMYGTHMGTLNVYMVINGARAADPIISYSGSLPNNNWVQVYKSIKASTPFQLVIEAIRADGYSGDIAIDDVMLEDGPCPLS